MVEGLLHGCRLIAPHFPSNAFNQRIVTSSTLGTPPDCCKLRSSSEELLQPLLRTACGPQHLLQAQHLEAKFDQRLQKVNKFSLSSKKEQINSFPCGECFWRLLRISPIVQAGGKSTKIRNENLLISTALSPGCKSRKR